MDQEDIYAHKNHGVIRVSIASALAKKINARVLTH
jgi:hypothetical protein